MDTEHAFPLAESIPALVDGDSPAEIRGAATIATAAYAGADSGTLQALIDRREHDLPSAAAHMFDMALVHELGFCPPRAQALQGLALQLCQIFRIQMNQKPVNQMRAEAGRGPLRVLALMAPGDLMTNTPLDFITRHLDVRLDLLFLLPDRPLPAVLPDHDVAFFAVSESEPATLRRLIPLYRTWPRPALNDPARVIGWSRDRLASDLASVPSICSPPTRRVTRAELDTRLASALPIEALLPGADYPVLIRPTGSHAGVELTKADGRDEVALYLQHSRSNSFFLTEFVDYRSPDGLFRKYRIAFFDGAPFLCHMAVSDHWMIHYLNAGMNVSAARRDDENQAMASFDEGFARRHAAAFEELNRRLGMDCYSIDCGETRDGRLLVFEADVAAVIHMMDSPGLFPYKQSHMQRVFRGFEDMLRRHASG